MSLRTSIAVAYRLGQALKVWFIYLASHDVAHIAALEKAGFINIFRSTP